MTRDEIIERARRLRDAADGIREGDDLAAISALYDAATKFGKIDPEAIARLLLELLEEREWRDISTAPRDGTRILLASRPSSKKDTAEVMVGYWEPEEDDGSDPGWWTDAEWLPESSFTRWQPLPKGPTP